MSEIYFIPNIYVIELCANFIKKGYECLHHWNVGPCRLWWFWKQSIVDHYIVFTKPQLCQFNWTFDKFCRLPPLQNMSINTDGQLKKDRLFCIFWGIIPLSAPLLFSAISVFYSFFSLTIALLFMIGGSQSTFFKLGNFGSEKAQSIFPIFITYSDYLRDLLFFTVTLTLQKTTNIWGTLNACWCGYSPSTILQVLLVLTLWGLGDCAKKDIDNFMPNFLYKWTWCTNCYN